MAAAAGVLARNAKELTPFIKGRLQAQDANREKLRKLIASVEKQIRHLEKKRQEITNKLSEEFESVRFSIEKIAEHTEEKTKKTLRSSWKKES